MTKLAVAIAFLALNFYTYHFLASEAVTPPRSTFDRFPLEFENGWTCPQQQRMGEAIESNLGVSDYLICDYRRAGQGQIVNVYVGYHASQVYEKGGGAGENSIHPPAHCLPGSGWDIIHSERVKLEVPGIAPDGASVNRLVIAKGDFRQLVYYWYQSRGRVVSQDWKKILYVGLDRATRHRTDGSLVRFTTRVYRADVASADATLRSLAPHVLARLPEYVPN
jgi:EpsI family protein